MAQPEVQEKLQGGQDPEKSIAPLWATVFVGLISGLIYTQLPENITIGPGWTLLALEIILFLPFLIAQVLRRQLSHILTRSIAMIALAILTVALALGVILMIETLPGQNSVQAHGLLRTAILLWLSNIFVFSLWYWEIDGGGPKKRHHTPHDTNHDFLFPQQATPRKRWIPHYLDYLFLAFTGATALSPTDTFPLSHKAKLLMMIEALIAVTIISIIIGHIVNII